MGGCLSMCLPSLRTLFPRIFRSQTPPSSPPAPADSPPSPLSAAPVHDSPLPRSADEKRHQAAFFETKEIPKQEELLGDLGADEDFCSYRLRTESSNQKPEAVCLDKTQLKPFLLEFKYEEAELFRKQSPLQDGEEFFRWRKPEVSDPTSPLDSELLAHECNLPSGPDLPIPCPQRRRVISAQPWQQGDQVLNDLLSVDHHVPVSYLSDESHPCSPEWHAPPPPPPPSLPHPLSQLPQEDLTEDLCFRPREIGVEDLSFRSRELRAQTGISHRSERKKAITAYGDTKSSSTSK